MQKHYLIKRDSRYYYFHNSKSDEGRVKWGLFNTILISSHNGPFDEIRKQYSVGKQLKASRCQDIKDILKELMS